MARCPDCNSVEIFAVDEGDGICSVCNGTGYAFWLDEVVDKMSGSKTPCWSCNGTKQCQTCGGTGVVTKEIDDEYSQTDIKNVPDDSIEGLPERNSDDLDEYLDEGNSGLEGYSSYDSDRGSGSVSSSETLVEHQIGRWAPLLFWLVPAVFVAWNWQEYGQGQFAGILYGVIWPLPWVLGGFAWIVVRLFGSNEKSYLIDIFFYATEGLIAAFVASRGLRYLIVNLHAKQSAQQEGTTTCSGHSAYDHTAPQPTKTESVRPAIAGWVAGFVFLKIVGPVMAFLLRPILGENPSWVIGAPLFIALWAGAIFFGVSVTKWLRSL